MTIEARFFVTVLLLLVLKAGASVRADEAAATKVEVPAAAPVAANKDAEQAKAEKKEDQKAASEKKGDKKDDQNKDAAKKDTAKKDEKKKAGDKPLNLKALAAPLNVLLGGAVRAEAAAEVVDAVIIEAEGGNADPQDAMFQQMLQQLRPVLASELGFVRLVLPDLTPEQRKKIKGPADAALKEAARSVAAQQNQQRRGGVMRTNKPHEPRAIMRQAIAKAVKESVSEEQAALFDAELKLRTERRKKVAIVSLVSMMDQQMFLTPEQRDAITESISAKWQDDWEKWTKMSQMYGERYFPQVPDNLVVPHLNPEQKTVWKGVQKIEIGWWWGGEQGIDPDADGWWGGNEAQVGVKAKRAVDGLLQIQNGIVEMLQQ